MQIFEDRTGTLEQAKKPTWHPLADIFSWVKRNCENQSVATMVGGKFVFNEDEERAPRFGMQGDGSQANIRM